MACLENIPPVTADSEMEEGEIVDELDDLSDISSEEEFLLRQRLQVLENYNNVLERKKAKRSSIIPGVRYKKEDNYLPDLSEISANELDELHVTRKNNKEQHRIKSHHKPKRRKELEQRSKEHKKKVHRCSKKKLEVKVISETSEESEDEYRNKRRKLADAVVVNTDKSDKTSLSARLKKMLCKSDNELVDSVIVKDKQINISNKIEDISSPASPATIENPIVCSDIPEKSHTPKVIEDPIVVSELIDLCTDDDVKSNTMIDTSVDVSDTVGPLSIVDSTKDSDDDLETLRQHALKTKCTKTKSVPKCNQKETLSEDEDSDTAELRLICLKSALLKKAIEMKRKQKLRKRLSQSSNLQDDFLDDIDLFKSRVDEENNNTDIESVDMDIGSEGEEKTKDPSDDSKANSENDNTVVDNMVIVKDIPNSNEPKEDELEEDEDLLRAKLLTSLSKNLPNLISPNVLETFSEVQKTNTVEVPTKIQETEEKKFIISLGESDSEGEHEATKNLTKMHMKLSEQIDFQQKLDMFLKSTRMEVEKTTLPDVVQAPVTPKTSEKYVAKAVTHLPKSEQIEYKNLVKRMAELEKIKQSRQASMQLINKVGVQMKDTLKPRKLATLSGVEEKIAMSRKKIAEESAKMLKLKEEATKLTQKYKIAATELRNITTAITLNKKQQRTVQNCLAKIRLQHQKLLRSTTNSMHSKISGVPFANKIGNNFIATMSKTQKENNPSKEEYKNHQLLRSMKVSFVNDVNGVPTDKLSIQVDVTNNKKVVKFPKSPIKDRAVDIKEHNSHIGILNAESIKAFIDHEKKASDSVMTIGTKCDKGSLERNKDTRDISNKESKDYKSPLDALGATNWEADPNAILCPFEVGGECKDPDCKYLHTLSVQ